MRRGLQQRLRGAAATLTALLFICGHASPSFAYLKFGYELNGKDYTLRWNTTPVRYYITADSVAGVTATQFQDAIGRAFSTWQSVSTASIAYEFAGFTRSLPGEDDGRSTLGFLSEPDLDRVLASTSYLIDATNGELLESDIFFNSVFPWSTAAAGERGKWDLESIALHEIGHLSGLGHSALGETELVAGQGRRVLSSDSVMFPIALGTGDISMRTLRPDDIAGLSDLYPDNRFNATTGSLSGKVTKGGQGVYGAHVVAFNTRSGDMVANFALTPGGQFSIAGLAPGAYVVRVEPVDDADTDSFFDPTEPADINFQATYFGRLVLVPRGGDSGLIDVRVVAK
jgi:hypothetical protein